MAHYESSRIRDTLQECTDEWASAPVDPLDAVLTFRKKLGSAADSYTTYLSTSITAGGYIRDPELTIPEVIAHNGETALLYADFLARQQLIDLSNTVDAVALGHVPGWGQSDYLKFWLPIMTRPDLSPCTLRSIVATMRDFEQAHDMELFNNSKAPHEERRPLYREFGRAYLHATAAIPAHPIDQTVQLVDGELSLGGAVEGQVSHAERIALEVPAYAGSRDEFLGLIDSPELKTHLSRLAALGARFVQDHRGEGISLEQLAEA